MKRLNPAKMTPGPNKTPGPFIFNTTISTPLPPPCPCPSCTPPPSLDSLLLPNTPLADQTLYIAARLKQLEQERIALLNSSSLPEPLP